MIKTEPSPQKIVPSLYMQPINYKNNGLCIYCKNPSCKLSKEHIIPEAIGGKHTISNAVCPVCKKITSESYETKVLKNDFLLARLLLKIKRKNQAKKIRKGNVIKLPLVALGNHSSKFYADIEFNIQLPDEQFPQVFMIFKFPLPGFMTRHDQSGSIKRLQSSFISLGTTKNLPIEGITMAQKVSTVSLGLTLAKIAYCYSIANKLDSIALLDDLRDLLLGVRKDVFNFVGSAFDVDRTTEQELHNIAHFIKRNLLIVRVQLFASCGAHPFYVVVGKTTSFDLLTNTYISRNLKPPNTAISPLQDESIFMKGYVCRG